MNVINFEITKDDTQEVLTERLVKLAASMFWGLPLGSWELIVRKPVRSSKQNNALHKWFELLAIEMEKTGVPFSVNIGKKRSIPRSWDKDAVKRELYHPVMRSITDKNSTAELDTKQIDEVAKPISLWLAREWKIVVPFPSEETIVNNMLLQ